MDINDDDAQLSSSFSPSSWSSTFGVAEAIASYHRSQVIITGQNVASSASSIGSLDSFIDEEAVAGEDRETQLLEDEDDLPTPRPIFDDFMTGLEWEEERVSPAPRPVPQRPWLGVRRPSGPSPEQISAQTVSSERTPLLRKSSSALRLPSTSEDQSNPTELGPRRPSLYLRRKISKASARSLEKVQIKGNSTFGQTLFNSIAILLGFGMLSEPLAFAYAGWIGGSLLLIAYGLITCYTAKILAGVMADDPQIRTYADIGNKAFGHRSRFLTSTLFCLELFSVSVVLVTLYGDSLQSIWPRYTSDTYKLVGLAILIPSVFVPLSTLAYTSIIGLLSTFLVIAVILIDGLSKSEAPGSLWDPGPTSFSIASMGELGVAFGLFMAGFSGHAVLPSLARDMSNPADFNRMINCAFTVATILYAMIGGVGYLMFGNQVSDEVSQDLLDTPGYNKFINNLAVWSLVVMPLTKFALTTRPVNITFEILLGLEDTAAPSTSDHGPALDVSNHVKHRSPFMRKLLVFLERSCFATSSVVVSILIPDFSSMMAFLGSFSAFTLCVIGPVSAKIALTRKCTLIDGLLLVSGVVMATWGTVAAFSA